MLSAIRVIVKIGPATMIKKRGFEMTDKLPRIITKYIEMSNDYNVQEYVSTFSTDAIIKERSLGKTLLGKKDIEQYFNTYFINYQTHTEIKQFTAIDNFIDMKVIFRGDFPEGEIGGIYKFTLNHNGLISILEADLEN